MLPHLLLQVGLILINAIIAFAESAAISINDSKLASLTAKGNRKARRLTKLTSRPASFFKTVRVSICFISFIACIAASDYFIAPLSLSLSSLFTGLNFAISAAAINIISILAISLALAYLHLVFDQVREHLLHIVFQIFRRDAC